MVVGASWSSRGRQFAVVVVVSQLMVAVGSVGDGALAVGMVCDVVELFSYFFSFLCLRIPWFFLFNEI